ncbi:hypothetical protein A6C57_00200 [Fibrella sp. ES10-3-2-2]|nr:hypothetical protein A6C57_00200 [Fibrella sp. ES10-3-2-2]
MSDIETQLKTFFQKFTTGPIVYYEGTPVVVTLPKHYVNKAKTHQVGIQKLHNIQKGNKPKATISKANPEVDIHGRFYPDFNKQLKLNAKGVYDNNIQVLSKADALHLAGWIDYFSFNKHAEVRKDDKWLSMYGYKPNTSVLFRDKLGNDNLKPIEGMACHNCGIVLPLKLIEVDHHMPQSDGEYLYTLKTLRALGLTLKPAEGSKGLNFETWAFKNFKVPVKERTFGKTRQATGTYTSDQQKWLPNEKGKAFLSLCAHVLQPSGITVLSEACKNTYLNLVPLCRACNGNKSDYYNPIV